jgi:calcineurin-like phosphoesterase family protein
MIYFTSDSHYNHTNICGPKISSWKAGYRDFETLDEMNQNIVDSINSVVKEDDTLIHAGDWSFGGLDSIFEFRDRLICKNIILTFGNHDYNIKKNKDRFGRKPLDCFSTTTQRYTIRQKGLPLIIIQHYSERIWEDSHKGTIMLYGHSHGTLPQYTNNRGEPLKTMDIGYDVRRVPFSLDEILDIMKDRPSTSIDHHK